MFAKLMCSAAVVAVSAVAASAADLPARTAPPVYVAPPLPVFTWTGFYGGINAGYAFSDTDPIQTAGNDRITQFQTQFGTVPQTMTVQSGGATAGGQIGYNYQIPSSQVGAGIVVVGVEADAAYTDLNQTDSYIGNFHVYSDYHERLAYLGTVRGRLGLAVDRLLFYGTGGFAYGESYYAHGVYANHIAPPNDIWAGAGSNMQTGYAVGGGVEYALPTASLLNPLGSNAVTVRLEYLHYDLGARDVLINKGTLGPAGTSFTDRFRTAGNLVRAALNYKFDFAAPVPVVARY